MSDRINGLYREIELTEERRFEPSFINYKQFHSLHLQVSSVPKIRAFAKNVFINQERKSEVRRRSDTVLVLTLNDAN